MYVTDLLTVLHRSVEETFDAEYPVPEFRNLRVSLDYPYRTEDFPSIWVDWEPSGALERAGIDHHEVSAVNPDDGTRRRFTRWNFAGQATFTVVALSSFERARLTDEMVRTICFGGERSSTSDFRTVIESNDLVNIQMDFDHLDVGGFSATPGTSWGTEEIIYESTLRVTTQGDFVADAETFTLIPLSQVALYPYAEGQPDPRPGSGWL